MKSRLNWMALRILGCLGFGADGDGIDNGLIADGDFAIVVNGISCCTDCIYHIHTFCHISEDGIQAIQRGVILVDNEELAAGTIIGI